MMQSTVDILLVEDNPADAELTMEMFSEMPNPSRIHHVADGVDALAFLRREGRFADAPRPGLVLLDLNLPRKNGREVLAEIKSDRQLKLIPVVILTSSESEADVLRTYDLHANCYLSKPKNLAGFETVVSAIDRFWLGTVKLPPSG